MATVTVRNLDDSVVEALKEQAQAHNRSLEAELREILAAVAEKRQRRATLKARLNRIAAMTPKVPQTDSAKLIREDRDDPDR